MGGRAGHRTRALVCAVGLSLTSVALLGTAVPSAGSTDRRTPGDVAAAPGPFVTLLFSRSEQTAADNCVAANTGLAMLTTTVAPYLKGRGLVATGTLTTDKTGEHTMTCTHGSSSLTASWSQARTLATTYGWSFVSHTATYPGNLGGLTPARATAETCGSAQTIDQHGLPGGHGLIAYPGAQQPPVALQTQYASHCFAWGRLYGSGGLTTASAGTTSPYWQHTVATNGGPCNTKSNPCYSIPATGSQRYMLPNKFVGYLAGLAPGEWFSLQSYLLVTGTSPAYTTSSIRWDCSSPNPRLHWTNDNERYCYQDWQTIVSAIAQVPNVVVTDPLTVGIAFGRPATYPPA